LIEGKGKGALPEKRPRNRRARLTERKIAKKR
jgi:hypothetical protein